MPNRMIKDSMLTSEKIASLSDFDFRVWLGLILVADDKGRCDARAAIIKGLVFPLRERVTLRDVDDALQRLAAKGCVSLYEVDGRPYLWFPNWDKHQRIRNVRPKYPGPDDENAIIANLPQAAANCGEVRPEEKTKPNRNQTETEDEDENELRARAGLVGVVEDVVGKLSYGARKLLCDFARDMGEDCVLKALEVAQEAGKPSWAYVRGVLLHKKDQGVTCAEDWDRAEARFQGAKGGVKASTPGANYQPSAERARKNADWLEEFLNGEEGKT